MRSLVAVVIVSTVFCAHARAEMPSIERSRSEAKSTRLKIAGAVTLTVGLASIIAGGATLGAVVSCNGCSGQLLNDSAISSGVLLGGGSALTFIGAGLLTASWASRPLAGVALDEVSLARMEHKRRVLKATGAALLGMGIATAIAGGLTVGLNSLCGLESGHCDTPQAIATFDTGYGLMGVGAASAISGTVLLIGAYKLRRTEESARAQHSAVPSLALVRGDRGVGGAVASWSVRF